MVSPKGKFKKNWYATPLASVKNVLVPRSSSRDGSGGSFAQKCEYQNFYDCYSLAIAFKNSYFKIFQNILFKRKPDSEKHQVLVFLFI